MQTIIGLLIEVEREVVDFASPHLQTPFSLFSFVLFRPN